MAWLYGCERFVNLLLTVFVGVGEEVVLPVFHLGSEVVAVDIDGEVYRAFYTLEVLDGAKNDFGRRKSFSCC